MDAPSDRDYQDQFNPEEPDEEPEYIEEAGVSVSEHASQTKNEMSSLLGIVEPGTTPGWNPGERRFKSDSREGLRHRKGAGTPASQEETPCPL